MVITDRGLERFFIENNASREYDIYSDFRNIENRAFFDVFTFATAIGISFKREPLDADLIKDIGEKKFYNLVSGMLKGSEVWINPKHNPFRQRFALAHEIGYYLSSITANEYNEPILALNTYFRIASEDIKNAYTKEELYIKNKMDLFALAILISEKDLRKYYPTVRDFYKNNVKESLSNLFFVSEKEAMWRVSDLRL